MISLFGLAASNKIFSITGQGDIKFLRPNGSSSHDITLTHQLLQQEQLHYQMQLERLH